MIYLRSEKIQRDKSRTDGVYYLASKEYDSFLMYIVTVIHGPIGFEKDFS
jgi:hypothetical protein